MRTLEEKVNTVVQKNTFYFFNSKFEEDYEGYIISLTETLLNVKNKIDNNGLKKEIFEDLLQKKDNGLRALLALTGFSNESFKRLITLSRIINCKELNEITLKDKWCDDTIDIVNITEWSDTKINNLVRRNKYFRKGIVNLFFEGSSIRILSETIPLFELKKLSIGKLTFDTHQLIDTIIRYKEKGSYSGKKKNNPETVIGQILDNLNINYESGDLNELITNAHDSKRTMDFIIPDKNDPRIIIECSFLATTSSGQGDKSKTELQINRLIKQNYPKAKFYGFVDGIGWYVRKGDLHRMVTAYEDVFTFHGDEIDRFKKLLESYK